MTLEEIRRTIREAHDRAREAYAATHSAWDHADDARIAYDEGDDRDDINNHVLEAVDYAARAELEIDVVSDILDALVDDLDDMIDGNGEADAPLVIDPAATDRYIAAERYAEVSASMSQDPLVLLRGIADNTGAIGAAFALRLFAVFAYAAIAYAAVLTMGAWSLAPLAVLTAGIFWAPRARGLVGAEGFSGHHAGAHARRPMVDYVADMLGLGLGDIAEVGGILYLFTERGWREISGLTLGREFAFTSSAPYDSDTDARAAFEDAYLAAGGIAEDAPADGWTFPPVPPTARYVAASRRAARGEGRPARSDAPRPASVRP